MLPSRIDKTALWKKHSEEFTCNHSRKELRERVVKGGAKQYVHQCIRFGDATTSPIKREAAIELNGGSVPPAFQEHIKDEWIKNSRESADRIANVDESAYWAAYEKYLVSEGWSIKRSKVLKRAKGICEGCLENRATQVHHLTYAHVGNEFLFELVAICNECHKGLHEEPSEGSADK
jgi:5-methylcytosine-specific restriction endonuclease McrA